MDLLVGNTSALEYWRNVDRAASQTAHRAAQIRTSGTKLLTDTHHRARSTKEAQAKLDNWRPPVIKPNALNIPGCSSPIDHLVPTAHLRKQSTVIKSHVWSNSLPEQSMVRVQDGLFMSVPEFAFLQVAGQLSLIELVFLAFELCGTYGKREIPLITPDKLEEFLLVNRHIRGSLKALRAVKYTLPNSASPMESALAMTLCLPYRLGGYGLPTPLMNYRINMPASYVRKALKRYYLADLYWPNEHVAVEYDSDSYHAEREKMTQDALRRNDLEAANVAMITVTARQIFDGRRLNTLAHGLARLLGKRLQYKDPKFARANMTLLQELSELIHRGS